MGNVRHFHLTVSEKPAFHKISQTTKKAELRKIVIQPSAIGRGDKIRTCDPYVPNVVLYQTEPNFILASQKNQKQQNRKNLRNSTFRISFNSCLKCRLSVKAYISRRNPAAHTTLPVNLLQSFVIVDKITETWYNKKKHTHESAFKGNGSAAQSSCTAPFRRAPAVLPEVFRIRRGRESAARAKQNTV